MKVLHIALRSLTLHSSVTHNVGACTNAGTNIGVTVADAREERERRGSREGLRLRWLEEDLPRKAGTVHLLPSAQPRAQRIHLLTLSARHLAKKTSPE